MPQTITTTVYTFDELSDGAKEKARDWWRNGPFAFDPDMALEDAKVVGNLLGITFKDDAIDYSGFCSQGDGASFEGTWNYSPDAPAKVREWAPDDTKLHAIADTLDTLQRENGCALEAKVERISHHYSHENTVESTTYNADDGNPVESVELDSAVQAALRDFMRWIYGQLKAEYDYQMSDECVDETLIANEYTFTADGKRCG